MSKDKRKNKNGDALPSELKKTIKKMKRIQRAISSSDQPPSMHEIDALIKLGKRYAVIVGELQGKDVVE